MSSAADLSRAASARTGGQPHTSGTAALSSAAADGSAEAARPPTDLQWKEMCDGLEAAGVEFTNGDAPGVRLRAMHQPHSGLAEELVKAGLLVFREPASGAPERHAASGLSDEHQDSGSRGNGQENADQRCSKMEVMLGWAQIVDGAEAALAKAIHR
jgi:hypothetical protein